MRERKGTSGTVGNRTGLVHRFEGGHRATGGLLLSPGTSSRALDFDDDAAANLSGEDAGRGFSDGVERDLGDHSF